MGAEVSANRAALEGAVFRPPAPATYTAERPPDGFLTIPAGERRIPAVWHTWTSASGEPAHFTVLLSHDYNDDLGSLHGDVVLLKDTLHANVLAYEYAGYGTSGEARSEAACCADAQAAFEWLTAVKGVAATRVLLVGHGLGSGPTLHVASSMQPASPPATLEAPAAPGFFSKLLASTSRNNSPAPSRSLAGIVLLSPMLSVLAIRTGPGVGTANDMFDNSKRIDRVPAQVLIAHPVNDEVVPFAHAQKLAKKAGARLWRLVELKDVGRHPDASRSNEYLSALLEFVRYLAPPDALAPQGMPAPPAGFANSPSFVVQEWLRQQDLPMAYAEAFLAEGFYDLASLAALRDSDALVQRIENPVHRQRLLDGVARLRDAPHTPQPNRSVSPSARRAPNTAPPPERRKANPQPPTGPKVRPRRGKDADEEELPPPFPGIPLHVPQGPTAPPALDLTSPHVVRSQSDRVPSSLPSPRTPFTQNAAPLSRPSPERAVPPDRSPRGPRATAPTGVAYGVSSKKMDRAPRAIRSDAEGVAGKERPLPRSVSPVSDNARLDRYRAALIEIVSAPPADERARLLLERAGMALEESERDEGARRRFEENLSKWKGVEVPAPPSAKLPPANHTSAALAVATNAPFRPPPPPGPPPRRVAAEAALNAARQLVEQLRLDQAVASALTMSLSLRSLQDQRTSLAGPHLPPPSMNGGGLPPPGAGARSMEMQLAVDMASQLEQHLKQNREVVARYVAEMEAAARAAALPLPEAPREAK